MLTECCRSSLYSPKRKYKYRTRCVLFSFEKKTQLGGPHFFCPTHALLCSARRLRSPLLMRDGVKLISSASPSPPIPLSPYLSS